LTSAFVDQVVIRVAGGAGGPGAISFRREKFVPKGGPDGGDGGAGGNVVLRADSRLNTLLPVAKYKFVRASDGRPGQSGGRRGAKGRERVIGVPLGTSVWDEDTGELIADLTRPGQRLIVAKGGRGGRGNAHFATPSRQAPRLRELGAPPEEGTIRLELRLLADVGLVGLPNVGKSTLLARISAARPKIADYPFTTLAPVLGVVEVLGGDGFVVADLPGLIQGAHRGAGLGHEFLRHVGRTQVLVHLLDVSRPDPWSDYLDINQELRLYAERLVELPQVVALNKIDLNPAPRALEALRHRLAREGRKVFLISAATGAGVSDLVTALNAMIKRSVRAALEPVPSSEPPLIYERPYRPLEIRKVGAHHFEARGTGVERLAAMTDPELPESVAWLHQSLSALGVIRQLEHFGAREGDKVTIGQREFTYVPESGEPTPTVKAVGQQPSNE